MSGCYRRVGLFLAFWLKQITKLFSFFLETKTHRSKSLQFGQLCSFVRQYLVWYFLHASLRHQLLTFIFTRLICQLALLKRHVVVSQVECRCASSYVWLTVFDSLYWWSLRPCQNKYIELLHKVQCSQESHCRSRFVTFWFQKNTNPAYLCRHRCFEILMKDS